MAETRRDALSKVPEVTLLFWVIKIAATTLGETGGDAVSMSMHLGYAIGTLIFAALFIGFVFWQIQARQFHPVLYWATIIATTTVGTTLADLATRDLGIGYAGGSALLFAMLMLSLFVWHRVMGTVSFKQLHTPRAEMFYWVTIMMSQTLGTALGDWTADGRDESPAGLGLGYGGAAMIFGGLILVVALLYFTTKISRIGLFWAAFILTRPLGAVLGDLLDKPRDHGGMELSRFAASAVLLGFIALCIFVFEHRAAEKSH